MNFDDLIRQSVQEILNEKPAGQDPAAPAPVPASQPITINIQGKPVTFRDQADLEAQLNSTAEAIRQMQNPTPPPAAPEPVGSKVTGNDSEDNFSNEEYIRLMNEDPRKATQYVLNHVMFNGEVEDPIGLMREMMVKSAQTDRQLAAYQFRDAHREVPLEDPRVGNVVENVRKNLNLPFTNDGLEAAYYYSINKGLLPDFRAVAAAQAQQNQQNQPQPQPNYNPYPTQNPYTPVGGQNPYLQAPPAAGRSAVTQQPFDYGQLEDMSAEQLLKLAHKLNSASAV